MENNPYAVPGAHLTAALTERGANGILETRIVFAKQETTLADLQHFVQERNKKQGYARLEILPIQGRMEMQDGSTGTERATTPGERADAHCRGATAQATGETPT